MPQKHMNKNPNADDIVDGLNAESEVSTTPETLVNALPQKRMKQIPSAFGNIDVPRVEGKVFTRPGILLYELTH